MGRWSPTPARVPQDRRAWPTLAGSENSFYVDYAPESVPERTVQTQAPPLPTNWDELLNFIGWRDPGFLKSLGIKTSPGTETVDALLKLGDVPANAVYNYVVNAIPATTEDQKAARETMAKLVYLGLLMVTPLVPGFKPAMKGMKALNRAAEGAKVESQVARRAAEIAGDVR